MLETSVNWNWITTEKRTPLKLQYRSMGKYDLIFSLSCSKAKDHIWFIFATSVPSTISYTWYISNKYWTNRSSKNATFPKHGCYTKFSHSHIHSLYLLLTGMAEPGGLRSMGSHRIGHDWRDLAAADRYSKCASF